MTINSDVKTTLLEVNINDLFIDTLLNSVYAYEQQYVKVIRNNIVLQCNSINDVLINTTCPLKIEGYEKFNNKLFQTCNKLKNHLSHKGPVTCHLFKSPKNSKSFPLHTDPDDVIIYVVEGNKTFLMNDEYHKLTAGDWLFISANTPHQAINELDSVTLSFGFEKFTIDKL